MAENRWGIRSGVEPGFLNQFGLEQGFLGSSPQGWMGGLPSPVDWYQQNVGGPVNQWYNSNVADPARDWLYSEGETGFGNDVRSFLRPWNEALVDFNRGGIAAMIPGGEDATRAIANAMMGVPEGVGEYFAGGENPVGAYQPSLSFDPAGGPIGPPQAPGTTEPIMAARGPKELFTGAPYPDVTLPEVPGVEAVDFTKAMEAFEQAKPELREGGEWDALIAILQGAAAGSLTGDSLGQNIAGAGAGALGGLREANSEAARRQDAYDRALREYNLARSNIVLQQSTSQTMARNETEQRRWDRAVAQIGQNVKKWESAQSKVIDVNALTGITYQVADEDGTLRTYNFYPQEFLENVQAATAARRQPGQGKAYDPTMEVATGGGIIKLSRPFGEVEQNATYVAAELLKSTTVLEALYGEEGVQALVEAAQQDAYKLGMYDDKAVQANLITLLVANLMQDGGAQLNAALTMLGLNSDAGGPQ